MGIEPMYNGFAGRRVSTSPPVPKNTKPTCQIIF